MLLLKNKNVFIIFKKEYAHDSTKEWLLNLKLTTFSTSWHYNKKYYSKPLKLVLMSSLFSGVVELLLG